MHGNFIQAYIQVLALRPTNQYDSIYVFDNFWYSNSLVKRGEYRYLKRTINAKTKDLFEHDAFVALIHVADNHFALAYGEFGLKKISYLDSLPSTIGGTVLDNLLKFCADERENTQKLTIFPSRAKTVPFNASEWTRHVRGRGTIPIQTGTTDCGVYCALFADSLFTGHLDKDSFSQNDIAHARLHIARTVYRARIRNDTT